MTHEQLNNVVEFAKAKIARTNDPDFIKDISYAKDDFWSDIPKDCKTAIQELKKLTVCGYCGWDYEDSFAHVWWTVLHEVDLWAEGEFREKDGGMTKKQAKEADKWLIKYLPLFNKYKNNYPEDWDEDYFYYNGQI